jgi:hypothetical protein
MKTHNAFIFHCLHCGNVVHNELQVRAPRCCRKDMVKAAVETIFDREKAHSGDLAGVQSEMAALAVMPH